MTMTTKQKNAADILISEFSKHVNDVSKERAEQLKDLYDVFVELGYPSNTLAVVAAKAGYCSRTISEIIRGGKEYWRLFDAIDEYVTNAFKNLFS